MKARLHPCNSPHFGCTIIWFLVGADLPNAVRHIEVDHAADGLRRLSVYEDGVRSPMDEPVSKPIALNYARPMARPRWQPRRIAAGWFVVGSLCGGAAAAAAICLEMGEFNIGWTVPIAVVDITLGLIGALLIGLGAWTRSCMLGDPLVAGKKWVAILSGFLYLPCCVIPPMVSARFFGTFGWDFVRWTPFAVFLLYPCISAWWMLDLRSRSGLGTPRL